MEEQYAGRQSHSSSSLFTKWVKGKHLIFGLSFALLSIFFVIPIIRLLLMSFSNEKGFSLSNYEKLLTEKSTWVMLKNTFYIVGGSTLLSLFLGIIMAWIIAYSDIRLKKGLQLLILIPFVIPSYIVTLSWTQLVQKNSFFMKLLSFIPGSIESINMYSLGGMIFVLGISHYPLVFILTTNVLRRIPRELEWAVRSSGGGRWKIFSTVTLPLSFPGIISGGLLAFLSSLDNFGIPAFLGIPANITVLSTAIYQEIVSFGPNSFAYASALSILLGIFALLGIFIQWLFMRKSKQHETTISDQKSRFSFGPYRLLFEVFIWLFVICISIVPILSMVGSSIIKAYGLPFTFENLTLKHYQYVLFEYDKVKGAIFNSVKLSIITMVVCVIAGTIIAYYRVRKNNSLTKIVEILIGIPFALPGMVLALSIIFAWMQPIPGWNPGIYGTIWILLIAYITRFMMLQVRGSMTAMSQVSIDMEEAAHVSGASGFAKWRVIMFPLLLTGVLSGACLVLITTLTELTVSSLLWSSGTETIGLIIFNFEKAGYTTYSTAFSVCIILMMLAVSSCVYLLQKWWMRKVKSI